MCAPRKLYGV